MLRRNLELLVSAGAEAGEIRSHGGGARSRLWNAIKADVTGLPVVTLEGSDAAVRGDAMLAGVAAGVFRSLDEACSALVRTSDTYLPDRATMVAYEAAYRRYLELFDALRPTFSGANTIAARTGA
jgi:xylulokinase